MFRGSMLTLFIMYKGMYHQVFEEKILSDVFLR